MKQIGDEALHDITHNNVTILKQIRYKIELLLVQYKLKYFIMLTINKIHNG
jgi:hypothetical protein